MQASEGQAQFAGNPEDLEQFLRLVRSPIRSQERERALAEWDAYKRQKQVSYEKSITGRPLRKSVRYLSQPAIDLRGIKLGGFSLGFADLRGVRFDDARFEAGEYPFVALKGSDFENASLKRVQLAGARLMDANFRGADLESANLMNADLSRATLTRANLRGARLDGADLSLANLVGADLRSVTLNGAHVYGISAWDVLVDNEARMENLIITPGITVDRIEVAQVVYLLQSNANIRSVLDTVCKKGVLLLGRFDSARKRVLDALRDELRRRDFLPMVFDFDKPQERDLTETVRTLAHLSRFIIADLTEPKSIPLELQAIVPDLQVPVVPIIAEGHEPFSMFVDLSKYSWVLEVREYGDERQLIASLGAAIIEPALKKHAELLERKAGRIRTLRVEDYKGE